MPIVFQLLPNKSTGSSFSPDEFNTLISTLTALAAAYSMANIPTPASLGLFPSKSSGQKMTATEFNNMVNLLGQLVTAANGNGTSTPTALVVGLTTSAASTTTGTALTFTASASGGTSPYTYLTQATNTATGGVINLGSAASGSWTPQAAGTFDITTTVTDSAGVVKISPVRQVSVTAATVQPTAPAAVTQLDATAGNGQVVVNLEAPAANGAPIQSYRYEYRAGTSGTWLVAGTTANLSYTITGLTNGTSYQFRAFATNSAGTSAAGAVVTATPVAGTLSGYQDLYIGDSLTTSYPESQVLDANSYPTKAHALLDTTVWKTGTALGQGYPAKTVVQVQNLGLSYVAGLKRSDVQKTFVVIRAGINNLAVAGNTVTQTFQQLCDLGAACVAAGLYPIFCTTTIARGGDTNGYPGVISYTDLDAAQADLNLRIRNGHVALSATGVVDLASDPHLNTASTTYQVDGIHETAAGRQLVADMVVRGLNAAAAGQTGFTIRYQNAFALATEGAWNESGVWEASGAQPALYPGAGGMYTLQAGATRSKTLEGQYFDLLLPHIAGAGVARFSVKNGSTVVATTDYDMNRPDRRAGYPDDLTPQLTLDAGASGTYTIVLENLGGGNGAISYYAVVARNY